MGTLLIFGLGYSGRAIARLAANAGWRVVGTSRTPGLVAAIPGVEIVPFAEAHLAGITHLLATAAPDAAGDPVLAAHHSQIAAATDLRWAGYLSTTGVYGDRAGGWVDEATPVAPSGPRGQRRVAAEQQWATLGRRIAVDLFRLAGIYGPGRSPFDDLRAGTARRIAKPGHAFGRIHRDDIAGAVLAALHQTLPPAVRVLNLNDDLPAEPAAVVAEAARLLGLPAPPLIPYAEAAFSPMAQSFWAENRKVASAQTQAHLRRQWRWPTYREGLAAILAEERANGLGQ